jgi:hypothetical protein
MVTRPIKNDKGKIIGFVTRPSHRRIFYKLSKVLTLCGSTRFKNIFEKVNRELTFKGWIVQSIEVTYTRHENPKIATEILRHEPEICKVHKRKISLGEAIFVIDGKEGYTGKHTNSEIQYARRHGIKVYYYSHNDLHRLVKEE